MAVRLKKMPNACSDDVWHVVEGGALIATVLPWPTSKGKRYVLVDHDNQCVGEYSSPQEARLATKKYLKR
jgi:hypothetical protein